MKATFLSLAAALTLTFGLACANNGNTDSASDDNSKDKVVVAQASTSAEAANSQDDNEGTAEKMTEETAAKLAKKHLALKKRSWGKLNGVTERDGKFHVNFETPEREKRLLGQRVLIVDPDTGVVSYMKRR